MRLFLLNLAVLFVNIEYSIQHGYLLEPAARSTAWRVDPRFPKYFNDMEMYCGGFGVQWNQNGGKCSICGENYVGMKMFEKGGIYYTGLSVKNYKRGQNIDINVILTANHMGWFEFRICKIDGWAGDATQACLDQTLLKGPNGETRFRIPQGLYNFKTQLSLPSTLVCDQCVFQWKYNTGNSVGIDLVTGQACLGCGPQEQFYGCSDITINENGSPTVTTLTTTQTATSSSTTTSRPSPITTDSTFISTNKCPNGDGYYADVSSGCQRYYVCTHTGTIHQAISYFTCPSGTLFDNKGKFCNYPNQVTCA